MLKDVYGSSTSINSRYQEGSYGYSLYQKIVYVLESAKKEKDPKAASEKLDLARDLSNELVEEISAHAGMLETFMEAAMQRISMAQASARSRNIEQANKFSDHALAVMKKMKYEVGIGSDS